MTRRSAQRTLLDRFRRSRSVASVTLITTLFSIVGPLVPKTAFAQSTPGSVNPGNNPSPSLGASNTGVQAGQTDLGIPEAGPVAASGALATGSVDPSTGAFTASIPFVLPQARGAVQPSLALVYSSSAGIGGVGGTGWSLNTPSIERHNLYGAPQYWNDPAPGTTIATGTQDAGAGLAQAPPQDRFTFGGQPLVPICFITSSTSPSCSPQSGNSPTQVQETMPAWATGGWMYYRLEAETGSNLRFFWSPNHQTWVVQEPSGATMELGVPQGNSSDLGGIDTVAPAALPPGALCTTATTCPTTWTCNGQEGATPGTCTPPTQPYVFRWNLVRHYDAQRIPGGTTPSNIIEYVWAKLPVSSGTPIISDLTDIYDTPHVGDTAPLPSSFAHHTHLTYTPYGATSTTNVAHAPHSLLLTGVDVTSQQYLEGLGSPTREQVRRYVLGYTTVEHQTELTQVQLDGWCSANSPKENPSTGLLPPEGGLPVCGEGTAGNLWAPATSFTYSNATPAPAYHPLPQSFNARPNGCPSGTYCSLTPVSILDVNADGMPDVIDQSTPEARSLTQQVVSLNSADLAGPDSTLNSWYNYTLSLNPSSPANDVTSTSMQAFASNYASGAFLNDGHADALVFDPNWVSGALSSPTTSTVSSFLYTPQGSTAPAPTFAWSPSTLGSIAAVLPATLQNCAPAMLQDSQQSGLTYPISTCNFPWEYLGSDEPFGSLDIDGDGLQDLLVTSIYGASYGVPGGTAFGYAVNTGASDYYPFLNIKFSTRNSLGVVAPFSTPPPQEAAQRTTVQPAPRPLVCTPAACVNEWSAGSPTTDLPNFCAGPRSATCLNHPMDTEFPMPGVGGNQTIPDPHCGTLPGVTQQYTFADINGDGLPDWVGRAPNQLEVWYGHGDGVFGVCNDGSTQCGCDQAHSVTFTTNTGNGSAPGSLLPGQWTTGWAPYASDPNQSVQFHDVDGDGFDDAIVPTAGGFDIYFIETRTGFDPAPVHVPAGTNFNWTSGIVNATPYDSVYMFADMDGSGVDDVFIENTQGQAGYVNVLGGERPGLLEGIQVANGISTAITYSNLPALSRAAAGTSVPWTLQSPNPVHAVTDVLVTDTTPGVVVFPMETQYTYTNPMYDGRDRQFLGFTTVEAVNVTPAGDYSTAAMHTKTTFYPAYCNDSLTSRTCPQTADYPNHALRGLPLLTEVYGDQSSSNARSSTGAALSTTHRTFTENTIYDGMDGRNVHRTYISATDTYLYDNSNVVDRSTLTGPLVDVATDGTTVSNLTFLTAAGCPQMHVAYVDKDVWGMSVTENDYGQVNSSGNANDGIISKAVTMTLASETTDYWIWRPSVVTRQGLSASLIPIGTPRTITSSYDPRGNIQLIQSPLTGTLPMARATVTAAGSDGGTAPPTGAPPGASGSGLVTLAQLTPDPLGTGNVVRVQQPSTSRCQDIVYDQMYAQLPAASTIHVNGCADTGLTTLYGNYARGLGLVTNVTTPDDEVTEIAYEPYGRLQAIYRPDLQVPGTYELFAGTTIDYGDLLVPRKVHTTITDGAANTLQSWDALDGFGRTALKATQADTSAGDAQGCIINTQVARNSKGDAYATLPATFTAQACGAVNPNGISGPARTTQYDAFGRIVGVTDLGTPALARKYLAMGYTEQDANQIQAGLPITTAGVTVGLDGHGRPDMVERAGNGGSVVTQVTFLPTGEPWVIDRTGTDSTGASYPTYERWMEYDSLGRMILNAEPATSTGFYTIGQNNPAGPQPPLAGLSAWTYAYNDAGQVVGTTDARGCGKNIVYDGAGRPQYEDYFPCTASQAQYTQPNPSAGTGMEVAYKYDPAAGSLTDVYDRAAHTNYAYDYRGRVAAVTRNIVQPTLTQPPSLTSGYAPHSFEQELAYDDLDRVVGQTTGEEPDLTDLNGASVPFGATTSASAILLHYSQRGVLASVDGSYGTLVAQAAYDADGLPHLTTWGDVAGTKTSFTYDSRRRLQERKTSRAAPTLWSAPSAPYKPPALSPTTTTQTVLEDDLYTLDAVGNATYIADNRLPAEWQSLTTAEPVNRTIVPDQFYRVTSVTYAYPGGNGYASPSASATATESPFPLLNEAARIGFETTQYDPFGNRTGSTDDANAFFDRSLGTSTIGVTGSTITNRVTSASGGVTTDYDAAGNLVRLAVVRDPLDKLCASSLGCNQLFDYEWDEVGRLSRARRWDFEGGETCVSCGKLPGCTGSICTPKALPSRYPYPDLPTNDPSADVQSTYDSTGARVLRASTTYGTTTPSTTYTVDIFSSLRLDDTTFGQENTTGDYDRSVMTDEVSLVAGGEAFGRVAYAPDDPMTAADILTGQRVFLEMTDHLGSTASVVNRATSELVERTTYSAFGWVESDYWPERWGAFREAFKFTGKEDDIALGITYFGARYYSPYLGMWMSPDPMAIHALAADMNPYAYVGGRLMNATDPLGLCDSEQCQDPSVTPAPNPSWIQQIGNAIGQAFSGISISVRIGAGAALVVPMNTGNAAVNAFTSRFNWQNVTKQLDSVVDPAIQTVHSDWDFWKNSPALYVYDLLRTGYDVAAIVWLLGTLGEGGGGTAPGLVPVGGGGGIPGAGAATSVLAPPAFFANGRNPQGEIDASGKGFQHAVDRHTVGGSENGGDTSTFNLGEDLNALVKAAEAQPATPQWRGNFQTVVNAGRTIGVDRATGAATPIYTVITTPNGTLVTFFPGVP